MILVGFIACFVVILVLAIGWFDEACRHGAIRAKLRRAISRQFPEFDVAPEDHA